MRAKRHGPEKTEAVGWRERAELLGREQNDAFALPSTFPAASVFALFAFSM